MPQLRSRLPSFDGVALWLNGSAPVQSDLQGKAVLVHFFASGCPLCREGMPAVLRLGSAHAPTGLVVIGAYQPRTDAHISAVDAEHECDLHVGTSHRCAVDVGGVLAARFENAWPPGYYVYDRLHHLRHYQMGNWNLDGLAAAVEACLRGSSKRG